MKIKIENQHEMLLPPHAKGTVEKKVEKIWFEVTTTTLKTVEKKKKKQNEKLLLPLQKDNSRKNWVSGKYWSL